MKNPSFAIYESWLRDQISKGLVPENYKFPFSLRTRQEENMYFARTREERDILMHELNAVCSANNEEVM